MKTWFVTLCSLLLYFFSCLALGAVKELTWDDLVPPTLPGQRIKPDLGVNFGNRLALPPPQVGLAQVVPTLNGQEARIAGFIVPLDGDGVTSITDFFLVPYFGACIHVPPPPSNQIIFVRLQKPYKLTGTMWDPLWIEGTLHTEDVATDIGVAGYTMKVTKIEPYEERK